MIRVMRLWRDGMATPVYVGLSSERVLQYYGDTTRWAARGRVWIEREGEPAANLGSDWRPIVRATDTSTSNNT